MFISKETLIEFLSIYTNKKCRIELAPYFQANPFLEQHLTYLNEHPAPGVYSNSVLLFLLLESANNNPFLISQRLVIDVYSLCLDKPETIDNKVKEMPLLFSIASQTECIGCQFLFIKDLIDYVRADVPCKTSKEDLARVASTVYKTCMLHTLNCIQDLTQ